MGREAYLNNVCQGLHLLWHEVSEHVVPNDDIDAISLSDVTSHSFHMVHKYL